MRISDWSSDVCSSDLLGAVGELARAREPRIERVEGPRSADRFQRVGEGEAAPAGRDLVTDDFPQIGADAVGAALRVGVAGRSEERRVGNECVSTCRSRWSRYN